MMTDPANPGAGQEESHRGAHAKVDQRAVHVTVAGQALTEAARTALLNRVSDLHDEAPRARDQGLG